MYSAPAKIILLGEHAVVYGEPAIAVPFAALRANASVSPAPPGSGLTIIARDVGMALRVNPGNDTPDNALVYAAQLALQQCGLPPPDLTIEIRSSIPIGSGFGSGTAVSTALIRALSAALGMPLPEAKLNALVFEVEKLHHGTPSGIDNTVIVTNRPVYFVRGQPPETFRVGRPLTLIAASSGVSASTRETVSDVRQLYDHDPARYGGYIAQIGEIVRGARACIELGKQAALGQQMSRNHELLRALTVSSDRLDRLVSAACEAGALGAKLSGGGRGGNVIALVEPDEPDAADRIRAALHAAGAAQTWQITVR